MTSPAYAAEGARAVGWVAVWARTGSLGQRGCAREQPAEHHFLSMGRVEADRELKAPSCHSRSAEEKLMCWR